MAQYMLLLYDNPSAFANLSPEDMQNVIAEYTSWANRMGQEGKLAGGHKLTDEGGKLMRGGNVTDGPYSETKEVIGGYFLINAKDYAEAVAVAKTCPHSKYGPRIDVRQVDAMGQ